MAYISFQPNDHFNTKLYTGNASTNAITGVGFQPDWVWIKNRNAAEAHSLYDAVRGTQKVIYSNLTNAQATETNGLSSFDSDGFTVGSNGAINGSSQNIVSWNWKAGTGQGSSNTDGSINTTYTSANTTSGFSISQYTGNGTSGATIGHGLGAVPKMIIVKRTDSANGWGVYHHTLGTGNEVYLNYTNASTASNFWITTPTTSVFSVSSSDYVNLNTATYVAYCFAEKKGFSKFGSYTGNGNNDGSFIYTGFRPAWVMVKRTNTAEGWYIVDNKRTGFNEANYALIAQASSAEETGTNRINLLSNGFKATTSNTAVNGSSDNYIYMAFAEEPLVSSNGVPAVAR